MGTQPLPTFGPCLLWPSGRPSQQLLCSCLRNSPTGQTHWWTLVHDSSNNVDGHAQGCAFWGFVDNFTILGSWIGILKLNAMQHLYIFCIMWGWANSSFATSEMQIFLAAECGKALKVICNGFSQNWWKVVSSCLLQYKPVCVINFDKLCSKR